MTLSCFIIDDEPLALALLESYVSKTPFLKQTGKYSSAVAAIDAVQKEVPDVLFLDIQMAELTGMEFARLVPEKTRIIFTTAFQQYALEGYKVNALDYLLKPFSYPEFLQAANKALHYHQLSQTPTVQEVQKSIFVKADYKLMQIDLDKILYIEGLKDYLKIYTEEQPQAIVTHITMKAMEEMLPSSSFLRVHRSFIVALDKIKEIERNRIIMGYKIVIPVGDQYRDAFQEYMDKKMQ